MMQAAELSEDGELDAQKKRKFFLMKSVSTMQLLRQTERLKKGDLRGFTLNGLPD